MLNAKQIIAEGLLKLNESKGKESQVGYDLSLKSVQKIGNRIGYNMFTEGRVGKILTNKTELTTYADVNTIMLEGNEGWMLHDGVYDITFWEGCKIPENRVAFIKQRSSLYRNGAIINSPVFDPGFETEFMGTLLYVHEPIFIELNARVAQIYFHECESAEKYDGQWQNDKQRL
jgi:deoxycytidine triphosphate deaminase